MLSKKQNWTGLLAEYLADKAKKPFIWGENDCIIFAGEAILAMTGVDIGTKHKHQYANSDEAREYLGEHFDGNGDNVFIPYLGKSMNNYRKAGRGDIAKIAVLGEGFAYGVVDCSGERIAFMQRKGLVYVPKRELIAFWRV